MSTFDLRPDAPGQLRTESLNIKITFDRTSATTGRISWNIPTPAAGCLSTDQAYCGMVVTIDSSPATASKIPQDGTVYSSDPTASESLFAGDRLGTAKVIGAFYGDRTTTFFDVDGLVESDAYYVSGFPVDCEHRYFIQGVHAYSTPYVNRGTDDTHGSQVVVLNTASPSMGQKGSDYTGLVGGVTYDFSIQLGLIPKPQRVVDSVDCTPSPHKYTIRVDGTNAQTYADLVQTLNDELAALTPCSRSPLPPGAGWYVYDTVHNQLSIWNGFTSVALPALVSNTPPSDVVVDTLWFNPMTQLLQKWNGTAWTLSAFVKYPSNPKVPKANDTVWFDGATAYEWNGLTWCTMQLYTQVTDPSLETAAIDGSYWYNTAQKLLFQWDAVAEMWMKATPSVTSSYDPNSIADGSYWYTPSLSQIQVRTASGWSPVPLVTFAERAPTTPAPGRLWFNPMTLALYQRNIPNTDWDVLSVVVDEADPMVRAPCDTWWNAANNTMRVWDTVNSIWVAAHTYVSATDPTQAPVLAVGTMWMNPSTNVMSRWNGACFLVVPFINMPFNPLAAPDGTIWQQSSDVWFQQVLGSWVRITPTISASDPTILPIGTMWYSPSARTLQQWNGTTWMPMLFSTQSVVPQTGTLWLNTETHALQQWNGSSWVAATPTATVTLDCNGNLRFVDANVGSTSYVAITDNTLFKSLNVPFAVHSPSPGTDGASSTPTYNELGVGTDGTDNIRSSIANDIRYELGYPVVDVELTQEQIDYAISKALSELRNRSGLAYRRGFFFMELHANQQRYFLTNKIAGLNSIVEVLGVYRTTSAFLASAHGSGIYGQIVMQHLYNAGTFDLLSFHIMAEYTKLMEQLFAAKITFTWNEQTRELAMHQRFALHERMVCIEATVERTEQDIMVDRYAKPWIRKYAAGICRIMLAEIRGKYSALPGASGNITLNANDLRTAGNEAIASCIEDIENYIADRPEEYGMGASMLFG